MSIVTGRIVLIGETQVGKTSIVQRYLKGACSREQKSTIGAVFHTHETEIDGKKVSLQIWDTAGQERYKALGPIYYRKSNAAIAVFDLSQKNTMTALEDWIKAFRENADDTYVIIAANKCDLDTNIEFTLDETIEWAHKQGAECIWTSAVSGIGIDDIFNAVMQHIASKQSVQNDDEGTIDIKNSKENSGKSGCC